jgi:hypothetical protein
MSTAASCARTHTAKVFGEWQRGEDLLWRGVMSNGLPMFKATCPKCGVTSGALPFAALDRWGVNRSESVG